MNAVNSRGSGRAPQRVVLGLALGIIVAAPAKGQDVTLDRLLSAPFPEGLVAAPSGGGIAWVQNATGRRNVWVASAPDYRARQLTRYDDDDGQEITGLVFSPDGRTLYFGRGGAPNRQGETPNPTSDPAGQDRAVWRLSLSGGAPVKVGAGSSPLPAPRGDLVAFLQRGQIWSAPAGGAGGEAKQLIHARGGASDLAWSPDGGALAFTSNRGDHAFVGVYNVASKRIRWLDPSVDTDGSPVWSPDGRRIAFVRIPAGFDPPLFGPIRASAPWSLRVADVATGMGREVWRAPEGKGSVAVGVVGPAPLWTQGDQLVFPWERDGWIHLYSVSVAGGEPTLLTPGEGEVEYVALGADRASIVYNTNIGDIDRRHLFRVSVGGGEAPTPLTSGTGIEWAPTPAGDAIAFLRSDARTPAHAAILVGGRTRPLAPETMPEDFPSGRLVEPEPVVLSAADGLRIHAQLFRPANLAPGERRPAVLFFHGGSRRQMLLGWHYISYYHNAYALNQYLASRGYVVLSVNYRSGTGYGLEFREAEAYGATGASEFNDVLGAGLYLRSRPDVDPARIGLWGGSYGGYLTAMGLSRASDLFAAGVDLHGVHDWNLGIRTFVPSYDTLRRPDFARKAVASSPIATIDTWRSPVLLIHADDDRNVDFHQSVMLVDALRRRGVPVEQLVFPDDVHGFLRYANWRAAFEAAGDFFDRRLARRAR